MAKCISCGKGTSFGITISHSHRRSNRKYKANIKKVKAIIDGSPKRVNVCTRCIKSDRIQRAI
ncbi:MAG: 50S ribosomal protein L28 [Ruminococcaceae bacterium]|nr:50S ribosomal protein L28 [Oscillospiraceae bacterium]